MSRRIALNIRSTSALALLLTAVMFLPSMAGAQDSQTQAVLEKKLSQHYGAIQRQFRELPPPTSDIASRRANLHQWQDELARLFSVAAGTVEEILKLILKTPNCGANGWKLCVCTDNRQAHPDSEPRRRE